MRRQVDCRAIAGLALVLALPSAQASVDSSLCEKGDEVFMSCPLAKGGKTVSMCARSDKSFYYVYGKAGAKPEMRWPAPGTPTTGLTFSHLSYAGATGGDAFAFPSNGYKYIVYTISGTQIEEGGVIVLKDGEKKPIKDSECATGRKTDTEKDDIYKAARTLPEDQEISNHGLPRK